MNACVESNRVLLHSNLLLDQGVDLLLEEVAFVAVSCLDLLEIFLKVCDVFNDFFEDVVGSFGGMVLQSGALRSQELHFLLVVVQELDCLFRISLIKRNKMRTMSKTCSV